MCKSTVSTLDNGVEPFEENWLIYDREIFKSCSIVFDRVKGKAGETVVFNLLFSGLFFV